MIEQFELKLGDVTPDAQLKSLRLDSLSVIEFMLSFEDELQIKFPDERVELKNVIHDMSNFKTVHDIANFTDKLSERYNPARSGS
jgi:acyl carrier protein